LTAKEESSKKKTRRYCAEMHSTCGIATAAVISSSFRNGARIPLRYTVSTQKGASYSSDILFYSKAEN